LYIKEPGKNPYYVDNYLFDDDPMLTPEERKSIDKRGGSGIIELEKSNDIFTANRDIILGLNIPDYY
jgi:protocatechuate 3,4-dioxygenase beta subunit